MRYKRRLTSGLSGTVNSDFDGMCVACVLHWLRHHDNDHRQHLACWEREKERERESGGERESGREEEQQGKGQGGGGGGGGGERQGRSGDRQGESGEKG